MGPLLNKDNMQTHLTKTTQRETKRYLSSVMAPVGKRGSVLPTVTGPPTVCVCVQEQGPKVLYLLNLYITKMAKTISTTDTSMIMAVLLWTLSLLSTRGAAKAKGKSKSGRANTTEQSKERYIVWL